MTNSLLSNLASGSKFEEPSSGTSDQPQAHALEYEDYDIFQPCREIDSIIDGQLYLGDLPGAMSSELRENLQIARILSVCPLEKYPITGPNHMHISVLDTEYENLLIHLPKACQFIQNALDGGDRVLVHCVMGVSRSVTVVSAYLMWTRRWGAADAISFVQKRRRCAHPNYGFIRQLQAFAECNYGPSPTNEAYLAWKRRSKRDVSSYLNILSDTVRVSPHRLYLNNDFPKDREKGDLFLTDTGMSHLLTISPSQTTSVGLASVKHHHINVSNTAPEALLLALSQACDFIREAISHRGQVLVHCRIEIRACIIVAAYMMSSQKVSATKASSILEDTLPLFQATPNFTRHLELFETCGYAPTVEHPAVESWLSSLHSSSSAASSEVTAMNTTARHILACTDNPSSSGRESPYPTRRSFDMSAFSETLAQIQKTSLIGEDAG
jgi:dual specificity phosphatase 12